MVMSPKQKEDPAGDNQRITMDRLTSSINKYAGADNAFPVIFYDETFPA
jgi:hypothetical protein